MNSEDIFMFYNFLVFLLLTLRMSTCIAGVLKMN